MKIELKNFKHSAFASQETLCYEAKVYVDGKLFGTARNQGTGGCTDIWVEPSMRELEPKVLEYCKNLPPFESDGMTLPMDLEFHLDLLAHRKVVEGELKRMLKKKIVVKKPDDNEIYYFTPRGTVLTEAIINQFQAQNPTFTVLNLMPFEKALDIFAV